MDIQNELEAHLASLVVPGSPVFADYPIRYEADRNGFDCVRVSPYDEIPLQAPPMKSACDLMLLVAFVGDGRVERVTDDAGNTWVQHELGIGLGMTKNVWWAYAKPSPDVVRTVVAHLDGALWVRANVDRHTMQEFQRAMGMPA